MLYRIYLEFGIQADFSIRDFLQTLVRVSIIKTSVWPVESLNVSDGPRIEILYVYHKSTLYALSILYLPLDLRDLQ